VAILQLHFAKVNYQLCYIDGCFPLFLSCRIWGTKVGRETGNWSGVAGHYGVVKCITNGELLLYFCSEHSLIPIRNLFAHKLQHQTTWICPWTIRSLVPSVDYVITRQKDRHDVMNTGPMMGAECSTDHAMILTRLAFKTSRSIHVAD